MENISRGELAHNWLEMQDRIDHEVEAERNGIDLHERNSLKENSVADFTCGNADDFNFEEGGKHLS